MKWNMREQNILHALPSCRHPTLTVSGHDTITARLLTRWFRQPFDELHRAANGGTNIYRNTVLPPLFIFIHEARRINDNEAKFGGDLYDSIERPKVRNKSLCGVVGEASRAAQAARSMS